MLRTRPQPSQRELSQACTITKASTIHRLTSPQPLSQREFTTTPNSTKLTACAHHHLLGMIWFCKISPTKRYPFTAQYFINPTSEAIPRSTFNCLTGCRSSLGEQVKAMTSTKVFFAPQGAGPMCACNNHLTRRSELIIHRYPRSIPP